MAKAATPDTGKYRELEGREWVRLLGECRVANCEGHAGQWVQVPKDKVDALVSGGIAKRDKPTEDKVAEAFDEANAEREKLGMPLLQNV